MAVRSLGNEWLFRPAGPWRPVAAMNRRLFLQVAAAAGGGLLVSARPVRAGERAVGHDQAFLNAYVRITPDDAVLIQAPCPEIGQGVRTSLPMIVAGELGASWDRCRFFQAPADDAYGGMTVGGSDSVSDYWEPLRTAAATARQVLVETAAARWGVPADECIAADSVVHHHASARQIAFGELASTAPARQAPARVSLRSTTALHPVGAPLGSVDAREIVTGRAVYGLDVRLDRLAVATVLRAPTRGASVLAMDDGAARATPGVIDVVRVPAFAVGGLRYGAVRGGVAVIAEDTWSAIRARDLLEVTWDQDPARRVDSGTLADRARSALANPPGVSLREQGDVTRAMASAGQVLEAFYELPLLAHACMEPVNFTADVTDDAVVLRGPTQNPRSLQAVVAAAFRRPLEQVAVHPTLAGGGFGRRLAFDYGVEAAWLSRDAGRPVKVIWTRDDDIRQDYYRPPSWHHMEAGLTGNALSAWRHHLVTASLNRHTFHELDSPAPLYDVQGGADMPYRIPNLAFGYSEMEVPVQLGSWRSVSHSFNVFAVESFLDEIASATGQDPLTLRLRLLPGEGPTPISLPLPGRRGRPAPDHRLLRRVLGAVAEAAAWHTPLPAGWGRGIACCYYKRTYAAHVAEVDATGSAPRVRRVVVALDCGQVINPDGARAQAEGAVMDAMSTVFHWEVTLTDGQVAQSNFDDYPALRMDEAPQVETVLVPSERAPSGLGEPPYPSAVPAITNAWFAATGTRIRSLPHR